MDRIEVSTVVYLPPEEIFDFLVDFPRYARYSKYLKEVRQHGDGNPGTEYDLRFAWWKVGYTLRSRVTDTVRPERIDWEITKDINASGAWVVEEAPEELEDPPEGRDPEAASRIRLVAGFDPDSADESAVDLPRFASLDWVVDKVKPLALTEAKRVVARAVRDLEGESRPVELVVHERPDAI
ncbi:polyketide cyclase [Halobacteriales archaeon QS_8_69_26]|nr:MAG: polyketide cyclase [Halobacteriales archaeon QS_8_69_26]